MAPGAAASAHDESTTPHGPLEVDARTLNGGPAGLHALADLSQLYERSGCVVIRNLFDPSRASELLRVVNRVKERWWEFPLTDNPPVGTAANYMRSCPPYPPTVTHPGTQTHTASIMPKNRRVNTDCR